PPTGLVVFGVRSDQNLGSAWQAELNGPWSLWQHPGLGTPVPPPRGAPQPVYDPPLEPDPDGFSSQVPMVTGNLVSPPLAVQGFRGLPFVFARGVDGALYRSPEGGGNFVYWGPWRSMGGFLTGDPAAARNPDGNLGVFARGP